jgi:Zn-dependent protease
VSDDNQKNGERPDSNRAAGGGISMGSPFGIPIVVSPTWFLIAAFITYYFGQQISDDSFGNWRYGIGFGFAVLLYLSVLLHELAHSVVAKSFGLPVRRIVIYFLGGVSEIEKEPDTPGREFAVAVAGPALSFALGGIFFGFWKLMDHPTSSVAFAACQYLVTAMWVSNLVVGVFNMLPGLPLDGGRVLRSAVWAATRKPLTGTTVAAWTGRAMAIAVLIYAMLTTRNATSGDGLYTLVWAAFIASFIWIGASQSLTVARLRERIPSLHARTLTRRAIPVTADVPLAEALRRAAAAGARSLLIVDYDGKPTAIVHEAAVAATPLERHPWVQVGTLSRALRPGLTLTTDLSGETLLQALRATPAPEYLVTERDGAIFGVLAAADVEHAFLGR